MLFLCSERIIVSCMQCLTLPFATIELSTELNIWCLVFRKKDLYLIITQKLTFLISKDQLPGMVSPMFPSFFLAYLFSNKNTTVLKINLISSKLPIFSQMACIFTQLEHSNLLRHHFFFFWRTNFEVKRLFHVIAKTIRFGFRTMHDGGICN